MRSPNHPCLTQVPRSNRDEELAGQYAAALEALCADRSDIPAGP